MSRNIFKKLKVPKSTVWQSNESGWILKGLEATIAFGVSLNKVLKDFDILHLEGPLGSGKTSLVKGIAKGLGINEPITSPSFALAHHYLSGQRVLFHLDLYRLENQKFADELFFQEEEEALAMKALMIIEWPSRLSMNLSDALRINLKYLSDEERLLQIIPPEIEARKAITSEEVG